MDIEISANSVIAILSFIGTIVGVWVNLNTKITKLEAVSTANEKNIEKLFLQEVDRNKEMKEVKDLLQQVLIKLTELETLQKVNRGTYTNN